MHIKNNLEDVWKRIDKKGEDECWEWIGCKNKDGYGRMRIKGKFYYVHRLVFELEKEYIPNGMDVLHTCDNPPCCNPKHLFLGTDQDNMNDMIVKGRAVHLIGEEHGRAKLTEEDVLEIRKKYSTGKYTLKELGIKYGVVHSQIFFIVHRDQWRHI